MHTDAVKVAAGTLGGELGLPLPVPLHTALSEGDTGEEVAVPLPPPSIVPVVERVGVGVGLPLLLIAPLAEPVPPPPFTSDPVAQLEAVTLSVIVDVGAMEGDTTPVPVPLTHPVIDPAIRVVPVANPLSVPFAVVVMDTL